MIRITTALLAASALTISSSAFACSFHKTDAMASYEGEMTTIQSAELDTPPETKTGKTSDSLATNDVDTTQAPAKPAE